MAAARTRTAREANRRLLCLLCSLGLVLGLFAGCKSAAPGLKSEFKADRIPSAADKKSDKHDPAQALDDGHTEAASSSLKDLTASQKKEKNAPTLSQLSVEKLLDKGAESAKHGKMDEAKKSYEEILRRLPDQPVAHHRLAIIADNEGDFRTAEVHYRAALNSNATDPDLLSDVGYSYLLQTDYQQSEQFLREALGLQPDHKHALNNLALLYSLKGDYDATAETLRRANSQQDAETKLAKLFPNGRPSSSGDTAETPAPKLRAPDLRPIQPPALTQSTPQASNNKLPATNVPTIDSQIPTARFTGDVVSNANAVAANRVATVPPGATTAGYSAEAPNATPNQALPSTGPTGLVPSGWNRLPVPFASGSPTGVIPAEMQLHSNASAKMTNASPQATTASVPTPVMTARPANATAPSAAIPQGSNDPLAAMPLWPHSPMSQQQQLNNPATAAQSPGASQQQPALIGNGNTSVPATSQLSDAQRSALILGMNCGPVTLFPFIDSEPLPAPINTNPDRLAPPIEQPLPTPSTLQGTSTMPAGPIPAGPRTTLALEGGVPPVQPRVQVYGQPQYPSTSANRISPNSAGTLPQTTAPAHTQPAFAGESFQAMP